MELPQCCFLRLSEMVEPGSTAASCHNLSMSLGAPCGSFEK